MRTLLPSFAGKFLTICEHNTSVSTYYQLRKEG